MAILRSFRQEHKSENIVVQVLYSLQKLINAKAMGHYWLVKRRLKTIEAKYW